MNLYKQYVIIFFSLILIWQCNRQPEHVSETILAKIGYKTISVNEFIRRSEYTIRPKYCRGDNYIHRKIVLNSLIAEKLLAIDAGEQNALTQNEEFNLYIKGRKEQAMRQWLYEKVAEEKVHLSRDEINETYKNAGRVYDVSYLTIPNKTIAIELKDQLHSREITFDELYRTVSGKDTIPRRIINFTTKDIDEVNEALYSKPVSKETILGPLEISKHSYLLLKVNGWTDHPAMSASQQEDRLKQVEDKLKERQALTLYRRYVHRIMKNKTLKFNEPIFREMVQILGSEYYKTKQEKKKVFNQKFWNKDRSDMVLDDAESKLNHLESEIFFTVNRTQWTVKNFLEAIKVHPLIFRRKKMPKKQFAREFKYAVVDLVRDHYITKDAYDRGYDRVNLVQRNMNMWRDNLLALYRKRYLLAQWGVKGKSNEEMIRLYLDPYLKKLREKYSAEIYINTDAFEKIKLTGIDLFVIQPNRAFPVIVPSFPQLTLHDKLDYGQKLDVSKTKDD